ncbi:hypothetical protein TNCV_1074401 [Trichonephila clavipes]|uniref:Uncharacterized protein n=1 Tax=Trichonephila clavipes TaxID=2585209 RepID=A0A8X6VRC1_TRICX|nr:hypothetical protein TNCV_1074401 [Trichonephila clavipes]
MGEPYYPRNEGHLNDVESSWFTSEEKIRTNQCYCVDGCIVDDCVLCIAGHAVLPEWFSQTVCSYDKCINVSCDYFEK